MTEISREYAPALLLEMIPEAAEHIAELYEMPAEEAVKTEHPTVDTFDLLGDALARPIIVPELREQTPDADLLRRCFDYTELLLASPSLLLREAAYFQILEALLGENVPYAKAFPYMRSRTRQRALRMLDGYGIDRPEGVDS
ncbi:hypothetical protein [Streptomyces fungicidicus]|uniref:Uncharacterized protein n=1 Tax=Streptomyces fungicidicus TaxID=68203 RepID=A0ACC7Y7M9_9ACTN|nr:hypothetical protein [Streptomyces fungicidicus]NUV77827.1 hypothetical protein [Streptomyces fungicidicus]